MALYTKAQFAEICGKSKAHVSMGISRGQLIVNPEGYIDDQVLQNAITKKKWQDDTGSTDENPKVIPVKNKVVTNIPAAKKERKPRNVKGAQPAQSKTDDEEEDDGGGYGLDGQKKMAEIQYKKAQIKKLNFEHQILKGKYIPTGLVTNVVQLLGHNFQNNYKNGADLLMREMAHKARIPIEISAEFKGKLLSIINKVHEDAINEAKAAIKTIIESVQKIENEEDSETDDELL